MVATERHSGVSASASGDRIRIDVQDSCGGLSAGQAEKMLLSSVPTGRRVQLADFRSANATFRPIMEP